MDNASKKVGIATVYTGYNYGSSLQAYATTKILQKIGYKGELLKLKGSIIPGRDVRLKKLFTIGFRSLLHKESLNNIKKYGNSMSKTYLQKQFHYLICLYTTC